MTDAPTALIAEDEPLLAAALAAELGKAWPQLRIVATVGDGASAIDETLRLKPDVVFLDIRMPGLSGLEAAAELADAWDDAEAGAPFPALVFVTAYDQYAVQAFEAEAIDYVLKPVEPARLGKTVAKLRGVLERRPPAPAPNSEAAAGQLAALLAAWHSGAEPGSAPAARLHQLPVSAPGSNGNTIRMVPIQDVIYLQAADKWVRVITASAEHLLRTPLKDVLPRLDPAQFWQIHRGTVVRADAIDTVQRDEAGKLHLSLHGSTERLRVSRLYAHRFKAL